MVNHLNIAIYAFGGFMLFALAIGFFAAPVWDRRARKPVQSWRASSCFEPMLLEYITQRRNRSGEGNCLTVQRASRRPSGGARGDRWCTMRDEFASKSFLAVTVAGLALLCSGLVALAFT
jgi:hypothetical protein